MPEFPLCFRRMLRGNTVISFRFASCLTVISFIKYRKILYGIPGFTVISLMEYRKSLYFFRRNSLILKANRRPKEKVNMI